MDNDLRKQLVTQEVLNNVSALNRFAFSLVQNRSEAEDLVSETVVRAFENMHQLKEDGKMKQWLFRILNNIFISNYRKNKKHKKINLPDENSDSSFSLFEQIGASNFTDDASPEKNFINKITKEKIQQAINQLPEEFRISLRLCDVDEFSYAEIAAITHIAIGTVRSRIARARNLLQKKLWLYALELGIRPVQKNKEHVCTCGMEEIKILTV